MGGSISNSLNKINLLVKITGIIDELQKAFPVTVADVLNRCHDIVIDLNSCNQMHNIPINQDNWGFVDCLGTQPPALSFSLLSNTTLCFLDPTRQPLPSYDIQNIVDLLVHNHSRRQTKELLQVCIDRQRTVKNCYPRTNHRNRIHSPCLFRGLPPLPRNEHLCLSLDLAGALRKWLRSLLSPNLECSTEKVSTGWFYRIINDQCTTGTTIFIH